MLKIKDNVDLEELEKYGFDEDVTDWLVCNDIGDDYNHEPTFELSICIRNHEQYDLYSESKYAIYTSVPYIPDILLDLINAGLVEKV